MYHGMLTIYKEAGYTSSDAVARLRGILRMKKIGHTGTLDPDAEGVLPMCLGNATRICELIADREKEYTAVMRLGVRTDTQDMSGEILEEESEAEILACLDAKYTEIRQGAGPATDLVSPDSARSQAIRAAAASFVGEISQIPPMYSAVKVNGRRLYDMARKGITIERKARAVTIYSLDIEKVDIPFVTLRVRCSKGTYIRTLCEDIGKALGTGAAMQSLLRTRVGTFTLKEAMKLDEVERIAKTKPEDLAGLIRPVDSFFSNLPAVFCSADALHLLKNGNRLRDDQLRFALQGEDPLDRPAEPADCRDPESGGIDRPDNSSQQSCKEMIIRMYDENGVFYGLYQRRGERKTFEAYKMFLPEKMNS